MDVRKRIQRMLDLGLTKQQIADRVGVHRTYIGKILRGERNPRKTIEQAITKEHQRTAWRITKQRQRQRWRAERPAPPSPPMSKVLERDEKGRFKSSGFLSWQRSVMTADLKKKYQYYATFSVSIYVSDDGESPSAEEAAEIVKAIAAGASGPITISTGKTFHRKLTYTTLFLGTFNARYFNANWRDIVRDVANEYWEEHLDIWYDVRLEYVSRHWEAV